VGCRVTESGDIVDNSGVSVGKAERCGPEYAMDPLPKQDFTDGQERVQFSVLPIGASEAWQASNLPTNCPSDCWKSSSGILGLSDLKRGLFLWEPSHHVSAGSREIRWCSDNRDTLKRERMTPNVKALNSFRISYDTIWQFLFTISKRSSIDENWEQYSLFIVCDGLKRRVRLGKAYGIV